MWTRAAFAMLFADEVWAVYGIGTGACAECGGYRVGEAEKRDGTAVSFDTPIPSTTHSSLEVVPTQPATTNTASGVDRSSPTETIPFNTPSAADAVPLTTPTSTSASPASTPTDGPVDQLETGVKIGIGVLAGFLGLALIAFLVETCYLRRRRREKALQRAVQEVERGERALAELKRGEEIVVLESRVSIVFDDGSDDEDWEELERGRARNGMSLARRD